MESSAAAGQSYSGDGNIGHAVLPSIQMAESDPILKGKISIRALEVIKGPKKKREDVLEKKGKKKKTTNKKGTTTNSKMHLFPSHFYS